MQSVRLSIAESKQRASQLLARAGLEQRFDYEPSQLSGGQQQRVAIARSLVNLPALVLADEPTGNLDSRTSVEILQTFQQLSAAGITVILVTHDSKVASFAHRTIRITDGLIESDNDSLPNLRALIRMSFALSSDSTNDIPLTRIGKAATLPHFPSPDLRSPESATLSVNADGPVTPQN